MHTLDGTLPTSDMCVNTHVRWSLPWLSLPVALLSLFVWMTGREMRSEKGVDISVQHDSFNLKGQVPNIDFLSLTERAVYVCVHVHV